MSSIQRFETGTSVITSGIPTTTAFFSDANVAYLARMASELPTDINRQVRIAEPGCSIGKETWSLAAALALQEIDFHIDASDINPLVLAEAQKPYEVTDYELHVLEEQSVLRFFDVHRNMLQPKPELRERVSFEEMDISKQTLQPERYGAVLVNYLLFYYMRQPRTLDAMLGNLTPGLQAEGILMSNSAYALTYAFSSTRLRRTYGLVPLGDVQAESRRPVHSAFRRGQKSVFARKIP